MSVAETQPLYSAPRTPTSLARDRLQENIWGVWQESSAPILTGHRPFFLLLFLTNLLALVLGLMPTAPSYPTPPLYPTPQTPSALAWDMLWEITLGCTTHSLSFGRKGVHQGKPVLGLWYFSIVNPPMSLDSRALHQQLRVVLHHHFILHHGHHPPWLRICIGSSPKGFVWHPPPIHRKAVQQG